MVPKKSSEWRTFKCVNKSRNAFWKITEPYKYAIDFGPALWTIQVHYGKNGTKGSRREKFFDSKHEAKNYYIKIISQKYVKGYVEQDGEIPPKKTMVTPQWLSPPAHVIEKDEWLKPQKKTKAKKPVHLLPPIEQKKKRRMKLGGIKSAARA